MDGNFILLLLFWLVNNALMYRVGYMRAFKDAAGIIADEVLKAPSAAVVDEDAVYWKTMYEDAVNDIECALEPVSEEVFPKGLLHKDYDERETKDAPGETTE